MASIVQYLSIIVMALYLLSMLVGFVAGKVYILEMSHVLQLTFLSIVCLNKVIPTFASLSYLKFIFGYNYSPSLSPTNFAAETTWS
jgi:hypothetical protein